MSAFTAVVGAEFVVVGLALYAAKNALTDLDNWVPSLPGTGLASKSAPHRFLEGLLREALDDKEFLTAMEKLKPDGGQSVLDAAFTLLDRLEVAPRDDTTLLWDFGGTPDSNLSYEARNFVRTHWFLPPHVAKAIVEPCRHD